MALSGVTPRPLRLENIESNSEVSSLMKRGVFLDRDGVINQVVLRNGRPYPPPSLSEFELFEGVQEAVSALRRAGFCMIVVTNQPDVATGLQRREAVETIHTNLRERLELDDIKTCFHVDADQCHCRKPKPGMLLEAAEEWRVDLKRSYMIGDRWRDIEAGQAAGCKTILIGNGYREKFTKDPNVTVDSLQEAAEMILASAI